MPLKLNFSHSESFKNDFSYASKLGNFAEVPKMAELKRYLWILAWTFCFGIVIGENTSIEKIIELGKNCTFLGKNDGWRCDDGLCIPLKYVCDGIHEQCIPATDESEGCHLFQGTYSN